MDWKCVEKDGRPSEEDFPVVFANVVDNDWDYVNAGFKDITEPYTHWALLYLPVASNNVINPTS